jgi:hypothetical protein
MEKSYKEQLLEHVDEIKQLFELDLNKTEIAKKMIQLYMPEIPPSHYDRIRREVSRIISNNETTINIETDINDISEPINYGNHITEGESYIFNEKDDKYTIY